MRVIPPSCFLTIMSMHPSGFYYFLLTGAVAFLCPSSFAVMCFLVKSVLCCWQHAVLMFGLSLPFSLEVVRESGGVEEFQRH